MFSEKGQELLKASLPDDTRVKELLAQGADYHEIDPDEKETVYTAIVRELGYVATDLLQDGVKATIPEATGSNAFIHAIWGLDFGLLEALLKCGANPNQLYGEEGDFETALDIVANEFHCLGKHSPEAHSVLEAMESVIKKHGGKYARELKN